RNAAAILKLLDAHGDDPERVIAECSGGGVYLNRRVFEASEAVIVHSPWCLGRLAEAHPRLADRGVVIPHGARASAVTAERRAALRERFGLPQDALLLGTFGFILPDKLNAHALRACEAVAPEEPRALLMFVGEEV